MPIIADFNSCIKRVTTKNLLIVTTFLFLTSCMQGAPEHSLYDEFKLYRVAIGEDQRNSLDFFSRRVLKDWLDGLLYVEDESLINNIEITWRLYLAGAKIEKVHMYEASTIDADHMLLTIYYSNRLNDGLRRMGIAYFFDGEKYLIDGFELYGNSFGDIPATIVDDFTNIYIPTVDEVLKFND